MGHAPCYEQLVEVWKTIPGHPDYEVSDLGSVRSWRYRNRDKRRSKPRVMMGAINKPGGYHRVLIAGRALRVHRLVLEAFVGPCPEGMVACHCNGDRSDNRLVNLRWDTMRENAIDYMRHGSHADRLSEDVVREIISASGSQSEIASRFGVTQSQVSRIRSGKRWGHVTRSPARASC